MAEHDHDGYLSLALVRNAFSTTSDAAYRRHIIDIVISELDSNVQWYTLLLFPTSIV